MKKESGRQSHPTKKSRYAPSRAKLNRSETSDPSTFRNKFASNIGAEISPGITVINEMKFDNDEPLIIRANTNGTYWALGHRTGITRIFDSSFEEPPEKLGTITNPIELKSPEDGMSVTDIRFFNPGQNIYSKKPNNYSDIRMIIVYASGHIRKCDVLPEEPETMKILNETREESFLLRGKSKFNSILCAYISYDNERLITGGSDAVIRVYETARFEIINLCQQSDSPEVMDGHAMRVLAVMYHPLGESKQEYGHTFLSGGWDDTLMIWDDRKSQSKYRYYGPHICSNDALDLDINFNNILTVNWSRDKPLFYVYKFNTPIVSETSSTLEKEREYGKPICTYIDDPQRKIYCMGYVGKWLSPDIIAAGGGGKEPLLMILTKDRSEVVARFSFFDAAIISIATKKLSKGNLIMMICSGEMVYVFSLEKSVYASKPGRHQ